MAMALSTRLNKAVREWMSTKMFTVSPESGVDEAFALMKSRRIRRLPVLENGRLVGIVTMGDVREVGAASDSGEAQKMKIEVIMRENPITVTPDMPLAEVAQLMLKHKISGLPVVEHGKVIGMITESDIFRAFVADEMK